MLIDYVGFIVSQQRMRDQFDYESEPVVPERARRSIRLSLLPVRLSLAAALRRVADRLEPAMPARLAVDCCEF
jgi:hypothetical protein